LSVRKAVDVAIREGAGDAGYTIAKALQLLRANYLELNPRTLVVVDEAAMVGTTDLRELLTATAAGVKSVLVGDAHQLVPVKARGGGSGGCRCQDAQKWRWAVDAVKRQRRAELGRHGSNTPDETPRIRHEIIYTPAVGGSIPSAPIVTSAAPRA
jgi:hypothetical protein